MPAEISVLPVRIAEHQRAVQCHTGKTNDGPPTSEFVRQFFAGYKEKILLIGIGAILAGMGLVVVNVLTVGLVLPFTAHLTVALFGFGSSAIAVSVTAKFLSGELSEEANKPKRSGPEKKPIKPRGRRCNRVFQSRVAVIKAKEFESTLT